MALKTGIRPGPKRKVQLRTSTRALAVTVSDAASAPEPAKSWRIVTTASRLTTPIMTTAASTRREVTKPRAIDPFCRFTTG